MVLLNHIQHFSDLPYLGALGGWYPQKMGLWGYEKYKVAFPMNSEMLKSHKKFYYSIIYSTFLIHPNWGGRYWGDSTTRKRGHGKKCKNNITLEVSDLQNPQKMVLLDHIQHFCKLPYLRGALG